MNLFEQTNPAFRVFRRALFVVSAALVAISIRLAPGHPWLSVSLALASLVVLIPPFLARRRFRNLLLSGDAERIVAVWREAAAHESHDESTVRLIAATAFAAYGWVQEARTQLHRLRPGSSTDATAEHRMFVETLLEAFDGDRDHAVQMAEAIVALPVPPVGRKLRDQVLLLRGSVGALARAFAHHSKPGDFELLEFVSRSSPLVSWAMRYAAAIVALDQGQPSRAQAMLLNAPAWPPQSAFRAFHDELVAQSSTFGLRANSGPSTRSESPGEHAR
jgi:hypothetical protein